MPTPFENIVPNDIDLSSEKAIQDSFDRIEHWALMNDPLWARIRHTCFAHEFNMDETYYKFLILCYFQQTHRFFNKELERAKNNSSYRPIYP